MKLNEIKVTGTLNDETTAALVESTAGGLDSYDTFDTLLTEIEGEIIIEDLSNKCA